MTKSTPKYKIIIVSADQEWQVIKELVKPSPCSQSPYGEWFVHNVNNETVIIFQGGWGKISAAASAQYAINRWEPDLIINLGTCGGFHGLTQKGDLILAEKTIVYDLVEQMVDPQIAFNFYTTELDLSWLSEPYPQKVKRTCLVSGDRDLVPTDIPLLKEKFSAVAGDWESASIAWVAQKNKVRCLILRGVSDVVDDTGSEAYGNIDAFTHGARLVLENLWQTLPQWLKLC
jgi:adenosylhomocysteine nucleosidase